MDSEIKVLRDELANKFKELKTHKNFIKGSINLVYKKCGNKNCKCNYGEKHQEYRLTYKDENGKSKIVYLSKTKRVKAQKMIDNYHKFKKIMNQVIEINSKLLKLEK